MTNGQATTDLYILLKLYFTQITVNLLPKAKFAKLHKIRTGTAENETEYRERIDPIRIESNL